MKCLQVAADLGMENNNLACDQKQLNINGAEKFGYSCHIFGDEPNCKINYTKPFVFKTGRRDCIPGTTSNCSSWARLIDNANAPISFQILLLTLRE